jgi:hypothetical protein
VALKNKKAAQISRKNNLAGGYMTSAEWRVFNIERIKSLVNSLSPKQSILIILGQPLTDLDFNSLVKALTGPKLFSIFTPRGKTIRIEKR